MKQKLIFLSLAASVVLLFVKCQSEDIAIESQNQNEKISIVRNKFTAFSKLPFLTQKAKGKSNDANRGNSNDPLYDFEIDSTLVSQIEREGEIYYTMGITRNNAVDDGSFENLVVSDDAEKAFIFKYYPSAAYLSQRLTNDNVPYSGGCQITELSYSELFSRGNCVSITFTFCGNSSEGQAAGPGCNNNEDNGAHVVTVVVEVCSPKESFYLTQTFADPNVSGNPGGGGGGAGAGNTNGNLPTGTPGSPANPVIPGADNPAIPVANPGTNPVLTEPLLLNIVQRNFVRLLNTTQKTWFNNPINAASVNAITAYLEENTINGVTTPAAIAFAKWAVDYLKSHPNVTIAQFQNWFMGKSEGQDGTYDVAYWDNPNLTFQHQNLPSWSNFEAAFPLNSNPLYDTQQKMYYSIGGQLTSKYNSGARNTCAIRLSKALNYSGVIIPNIPGQTFKGADNKYYFLLAKSLNSWMRKTFGTNPAMNNNQYNANHYHITSTAAGEYGINLPDLLVDKKGIYSLVSSNPDWGSGHADLLYDDMSCGNDCHFADAPIDYIDIWILN